jgi:CBS domain-containing protein
MVSQALEGLTVGQIMTTAVSIISPDATARDLLDKMMVEKHLGYPVVDNDRVLGIVTLQDVQKIPAAEQPNVKVSKVMTSQVLTVRSNTPAIEAVQIVSRNRIGRLLVVDDGRLVGIISRSDLMRMLEVRAAETGWEGRR